jgi:hypothetical protein
VKIFSTSQNPKDTVTKMNTLSQSDIKVGDLVRIKSSGTVAQVTSMYHSSRDNCSMLTLTEYRQVAGHPVLFSQALLYGTVTEAAVTRISDTATYS